MMWIYSAKIEANTFLHPDDYVDDLDNTQYANGVNIFGEERIQYLFVSG